jgi:hypothetical protein
LRAKLVEPKVQNGDSGSTNLQANQSVSSKASAPRSKSRSVKDIDQAYCIKIKTSIKSFNLFTFDKPEAEKWGCACMTLTE